jgi:hypothetical protein
MARTLIGVVHGTASRMVHRIDILEPGEDDTHFAQVRARLPPGKSLHTIPLAALARHPLTGLPDTRLQAVIAAAPGIGLMPPARCAVVDVASNTVVEVLMADPTTYSPPVGRLLVPSNAANPGWSYDPVAKVLIAPPFVPSRPPRL